MPKARRIVLLRHGESQGNIDKTLFERMPDHKIPLTPRGREQAREAGRKLHQLLLPGDRVRIYVSPYTRTRETASLVIEGLENRECDLVDAEDEEEEKQDDVNEENGDEYLKDVQNGIHGKRTSNDEQEQNQSSDIDTHSGEQKESTIERASIVAGNNETESRAVPSDRRLKRRSSSSLSVHAACKRIRGEASWDIRVFEEPRIREQDWGNFQDRQRMQRIVQERSQFGPFFYRISEGESGADVYDRVSTFMETLYRVFEKEDAPNIVIIVTHGLLARLFLMRFYHWSVESFESLDNLHNCEALHMVLDPHKNKYILAGPIRRWKEIEPGAVEKDEGTHHQFKPSDHL